MSSEVHVAALLPALSSGLDDPDRFDRVRHTADDRPNTDTLPALTDPAADHFDEALARRRLEVDEKHRLVSEFLDRRGLDAVVLGRADSFAWFTSGGDASRHMACDRSAVLVYVNRNSRAVICDNVQSARVFEEEVAGLGFQLKERPWYDDPSAVVAELGHSRKLAADIPFDSLPNEFESLKALRLHLTKLERQRLRELGRTLTLAVEATCRNFEPGESEADLAGHLAHRLLREGVVPVDLRVAGDDRLARFRQPSFKAAPINRRAILTAVGRRHGLCAAVTRIVSLGPVDPEFRAAHSLAAMVDATCIYFSRPGESIREVFRRARRIYEKFEHADEWMLDYQGQAIGYSPCERAFKPDDESRIGSDMPLAWSPSVGAARSGDTVVVDDRGYEVVTEAQNWPKLEVMVKGFPMTRPGILERPA